MPVHNTVPISILSALSSASSADLSLAFAISGVAAMKTRGTLIFFSELSNVLGVAYRAARANGAYRGEEDGTSTYRRAEHAGTTEENGVASIRMWRMLRWRQPLLTDDRLCCSGGYSAWLDERIGHQRCRGIRTCLRWALVYSFYTKLDIFPSWRSAGGGAFPAVSLVPCGGTWIAACVTA